MSIVFTTINNSSSIARIGYDLSSKTMQVDYHTTGLYEYSDVNQEEYYLIAKTLRENESMGKQVRAVIKGKRFKKII